MLSPMEHIFFSRPHRVCQKWRHFLPIYERYFSSYRGTRVKFLEFGVSQGGSLDLWAEYFGKDAQIYGVDINPECRRFESAQVQILIGDQDDRGFLKSVAEVVGEIDLVLDDGGHRMEQQINSFQELFPHIRDGGVYICEDVHTSYQEAFGGGLRKPESFIEYMKGIVDEMHFFGIPNAIPTTMTKSVNGIAFFNALVAIEKGRNLPPLYVEVGR